MKDFDLNSVGKRMPYTTPDNFFEEVTQRCASKVSQIEPTVKYRPKRKAILATISLSAAAVAATLALILTPAQQLVEVPQYSFEEYLSELSDAELDALDFTLTTVDTSVSEEYNVTNDIEF